MNNNPLFDLEEEREWAPNWSMERTKMNRRARMNGNRGLRYA